MKIASKNCKQKLQAEIASKFLNSNQVKQGFTNNLPRGLNFLKRKNLKKYQKLIYYQKISPKTPEFFPSKS